MQDKEVLIEEKENRRSKMKKGIFILPNLITSTSLFGGFYSIVACLDGKFEYAAIAIIISGLLDGLDGRVARLTGTSSKFGMEYDSLADLVAFGLAPGILVFTWALRPFGRYGWLAAFLYVVCAALRLARFNVQVDTVESNRFVGIPTPAAAGFIASTVLFFHYLGAGDAGTTKHVTVLLLTYSLAFLMVSSIRYSSFKGLNFSERAPFSFLLGIILFAVIIAAEPAVMLFIIGLLYASSGPLMLVFERTGVKVPWVSKSHGIDLIDGPLKGRSKAKERGHSKDRGSDNNVVNISDTGESPGGAKVKIPDEKGAGDDNS